jgi:hypothetical protein
MQMLPALHLEQHKKRKKGEQRLLTIATPSLRESLDGTTAATAAMVRVPFLANLGHSKHQHQHQHQYKQKQQQKQLNRRGAQQRRRGILQGCSPVPPSASTRPG